MTDSTDFAAALAWASKGYNVVPRKSVDAKRPAVKWTELQSRRVTDSELARWEPLFANGLGFITGAISGVIVIETDGPAGETVLDQFEFEHGPLPETLTIRSGSGRGRHLHFKHLGGKVKTTANENIKVDVRGDGGFCVLPPSLHKSGDRYLVEHDAEPAELPDGLLEFIDQKAAEVNGQPMNGRALNRKPLASAEALGDNLSRQVPVNRRNVAIVQSMLDALPDRHADEYDLWLDVGFALHSFDSGRVGLALWRRFSARHAVKAEETDFENVWATFDRPYDGAKITIGTLWAMARDHGWEPKPWDMREG